MIDVDKPLKKGFFIPFDSSTNVRSCLLSGHKPLSENIVFLVSNSQRAQTLLKHKLIEVPMDFPCRKTYLGLWSEHRAEPHFPEDLPVFVSMKAQLVLPTP